MGGSQCRACAAPLEHTFVDLGMSPLANSYLGPDQLHRMEPFYPLHAYVCGRCFSFSWSSSRPRTIFFRNTRIFRPFPIHGSRMRERMLR